MEARKCAVGEFGRAWNDIGAGMFGQSMESEKVFGIP
jgi:hypothetical protein